MKLRLLSAAVLATLTALPVAAHQAGDLMLRFGAANVSPNAGSQDVAGLGEFDIDSNTQLGLNLTYMATDHVGIELLAATPFSHKVSLPSLGNIAEVQHLPPTLMAQYYFGDAGSKVRPYLGVGVNATLFFEEKFTNDLDGALTDLSADTSWGVAGQVGVDYLFSERWLFNASVWYLDIDTDVNFKLGGEAVTIATEVDPWVYMVSFGYRF
ncbi:outer membrane protein OmpW [Ferrimonas gelatinilytica]|uniref:Outer membrane protein OmpW n=1 Tax=Ferrimonas gelatinilytica TaxID=1255257 RepID=A0ABP9SBX0_9GAMM